MFSKAVFLVVISVFGLDLFASECTNLFLSNRNDVTFKFDEKRVPSDFVPRASYEGKLVLYRGDKINLEKEGISSNAYRNGQLDTIKETINKVEAGNEESINNLIDKHTSGSYGSPLISASYSPEMAQTFALRSDETIYRIEVDRSRAIFDRDNIGGTGEHGEIFIIGRILPSEITAVKIDNSMGRSELQYTDENGRSYIRRFPRVKDISTQVKDPTNWRIID
tara:strand:- start:152542 stop:153210 length:669 start_codon:yes stop_codon:yes gene_type:complete